MIIKSAYLSALDDVAVHKLVCQRLAQHCPVTAPSVMLVHSSYDMTTTDLADSMDSANALQGVVVTLFDPKILTDVSGFIPYQNCQWRKFERNGTKFIKFSFKNDSSLDYTHNLKSYIKLCTSVALTSSRGNLYFCEVTDSRNGSLYIRVVKNLCPRIDSCTLSYNVWLGNNDKLMVKYYNYGVHSNASSTLQRLKLQYVPKKIIVSRTFYDAAMIHLMGMNTTKFTVQAVFEYVRSLNSRVIVNGTDVVGGERLGVDDYEGFCCALYYVAYRRRWMEHRLVSEVTADEQQQRTKGQSFILVRMSKR